MKNLIMYNYGIEAENFNVETEIITTFYIDYQKYYLIKIRRSKQDMEEIYSITTKIINHYHRILKNKFGEVITEHEDSQYVLLKIIGSENYELDLEDILKEQIEYGNSNSILNRNDWNSLWSEKVDYLEYQISELGKNHPLILKSFSYYIGLAENAIEYFNMIPKDNLRLFLSQKRVNYPNFSLNYNNPLNIIVDYKVRDYAEYIKSKFFFSDSDVLRDINYIANKKILNEKEANLLYARLLYPSYYFDSLTLIIEKGTDEDSLLKYIDKVDDYETFLKNTYDILSKNYNILKVDWLIAKKA